MANLLHQHPNEGWAGDNFWWVDLNVVLNSQSAGANTSNVTISIVTYGEPGYSQNGVFNGQIWVNGGLVANASASYNIGTSGVTIASWTGDIAHDVNGNATPSIEYYANMPVTSMSRRGANWGLTRIPLAPTISSTTSSNIKATTATLNGTVSSNGHGTSTTITYFYRVSGIGSYVNAGTGSSKNLTGLKPGTNYQWYITATNNNGDVATGSVQTFKTKSVPGMLPVLMGLIG